MIIDLFTYTNASDNGAFSLETLIEAARDAHLDGIAITDRATSSRAREYAAISAREGFFVAQGIELKTNSGIVAAFPSVIDDEYVSEGWRSLGETPNVNDVLDYFHERGGVVIARDIYNRGEGFKDRVYSAKDSKGRGFDAVDTIAVYRRRIDNELSIEAQQVLGISACAGSGVFSDLEDIGYCATLFAGEIRDQASFVAAVRSPLHWACALRDLGEACPMGSAPKVEEDEHRRDDRRGEHRGDRRGGRRDGERRYGRERGEQGERRDGGRRRDGERRDGGRRDGERRDGGRRDGERRDGGRRDGERRDGEHREGDRRRNGRGGGRSFRH